MILKINEIKNTVLKKYLSLLLPVFILFSCGINVDFPKETLEEDIVKLVKETLNRDIAVYQCGETLYIDVCLENFSFDNKEKFKKDFLLVQEVYSTVGKAPLNTNAKINYVVISAFDPQHQFLLKIYENVEDFRKYYWHFISREDFYERQLMETYQTNGKMKILEDKHDITKEEFLARLIAAPISGLGLKFSHTEKDRIYYIVPKKIGDDRTKILLKTMIQKLADRNMKKYEIFSVKSAILLDEEKNTIIDIPLSV